MHAYFAEYLDALRSQHAELKRTYADAPAAALDWQPAPGANSLVVLVVHVAGAQSFLLGDLLSGRPSQRNRDSEFSMHALDAATLNARLDAAMEDATASIAALTLEFDSVRAALAAAKAQLASIEDEAKSSAGDNFVTFREALTRIRKPTITFASDVSYFELLSGSSRDADADGLNDNEHSVKSQSASVAADWRPADGWQLSALLAAVEKQ